MRIAVAALVLIFATARARADDDGDTKSPLAAEAMSLGPTALGAFTFLAAEANAADDGPSTRKTNFELPAVLLTIGPSLGHLYTHSYGLAALGAAVRFGGALLVLDSYGHCDPTRPPNSFGDCVATPDNQTEAQIGLAIIGITALAQLVDSPLSATRYNHAHARTVIVPTAAPGRIGLALVGTF